VELSMTEQPPTREEIFILIEEVIDHEVPALIIFDLGIVRDAEANASGILVTITPTYSGCPAMAVIEEGVKARLHQAGFEQVTVRTVLSPAWSSTWISEAGRKKLKEYGIAPPMQQSGDLITINPKVPCPFCDSSKTERRSQFGPTACKAMYFCRECQQPFEYFKDF
jgi:ring-1,2-phenylacetyl-CoA epoxidase subunit PaaD